MRATISAFFAGSLFAIGLVLGGMTQPSKVIGFLDIAGNWDPSLAFVMGGAILVLAPLLRIIKRLRQPLLAPTFSMPSRKDIDLRLITGAALFGVGWGLGGYCPGPALTSVGGFSSSALTFAGSMLVGFLLKAAWDAQRKSQVSEAPPAVAPQAGDRPASDTL
ncbi:MAG: YeeE/YedE family protein [Myxococcales bacterium]|nr:YeeE/YedE family protein [Myxococcales bacterium]